MTRHARGKLAAEMGFAGPEADTLVNSSCNEILYHLADKDTMMFALDNRIYTLKRGE